jgi:hypothetical protein
MSGRQLRQGSLGKSQLAFQATPMAPRDRAAPGLRPGSVEHLVLERTRAVGLMQLIEAIWANAAPKNHAQARTVLLFNCAPLSWSAGARCVSPCRSGGGDHRRSPVAHAKARPSSIAAAARRTSRSPGCPTASVRKALYRDPDGNELGFSGAARHRFIARNAAVP